MWLLLLLLLLEKAPECGLRGSIAAATSEL